MRICPLHMLICMRTTLNIDDVLMNAVRRRADASGQTITAVIEDALRRSLADSVPAAPYDFRWVTVPGGPRPGVDVADRDALLALMERS